MEDLSCKYINRVLSSIFILVTGIIPLTAQKEEFEMISNAEYQLINEYFEHSNDNRKVNIYFRTYFDKAWVRYFQDINVLFSDVGIPTIISDKQLDSTLTEDRLGKISNSILISLPLELKQRKLSNKINLVDSFDSPTDLKEGVMRISKPIILGDIAVFRAISIDEAPIHIMSSKSGKWEIIYTSYDWLILE